MSRHVCYVMCLVLSIYGLARRYLRIQYRQYFSLCGPGPVWAPQLSDRHSGRRGLSVLYPNSNPRGRGPGRRACVFPPPQYYAQFNTALLLFMGSTTSSGSASHATGPAIFSQALPEMSGNSVSPIRAPQDTPEILEWLHLPYDGDTPMRMPQSTSVLTRRKLIVEGAPDAGSPAQVVVTTDEPLGPYKARIGSLTSRRQSYRARARKAHEGAVQGSSAVQVQLAAQLQADEDLFDEEGPLTSMAALDFHEMPFDRITIVQACRTQLSATAIVRNRFAKWVSEAVEDFNRRCLAALQAWAVLPGEPWPQRAHL